MSDTKRIDTGCEDDYLPSGTAMAMVKWLKRMPPTELSELVDRINTATPEEIQAALMNRYGTTKDAAK